MLVIMYSSCSVYMLAICVYCDILCCVYILGNMHLLCGEYQLCVVFMYLSCGVHILVVC